ncbi:hypothetical protein EGW08_014688, partial [Elysia chlorotica]
TSTTLTSVNLEFELGKEFDESTADGRKVKSTCTVEGNKLITTQKGEIDSVITREFTADSFVMTLTAKGVTCTSHTIRKRRMNLLSKPLSSFTEINYRHIAIGPFCIVVTVGDTAGAEALRHRLEASPTPQPPGKSSLAPGPPHTPPPDQVGLRAAAPEAA